MALIMGVQNERVTHLLVFQVFVRRSCKWSFILNELAYCLISQEFVYDDAKMVFKMTKLHSEKADVNQR